MKIVKAKIFKNVEPTLFFLFPLFFLTIKSFSNFILVLITLYCLIRVFFNYNNFLKKRDNKFWLLFTSITLPFTAELVVQILRTGFQIGALDSPSRFLAAGVIFVYLSRSDGCSKYFHCFSFSCLISVFLTLIPILFFKEYYWHGRAASYFSDPNTIAVYCVVLCFCSFYFVSKVKSSLIQLIVHISVLLASVYIIIYSGTRTSWASFAIVLLISLFLVNYKKIYIISYFFILVPLLFSLPFFNTEILTIIQKKYVETTVALSNYFSGVTTPSSIGIRLNLILIDIELIKNHLWLGMPDGKLPSFESLNSSLPSITELDYHTRLFSGSHVEMLAQMSRKGFILGLLTTISLFIIPLIISFRSMVFGASKNLIMCTAFLVTLSLFISSFGIQVFPLKMTSSFWAIFLVLIYSNYYQMSGSPNQNS